MDREVVMLGAELLLACGYGLVAGILFERGRIREKLLRVADALECFNPDSPETCGVSAGLRAVARDIGK